jgi:hypothetical protein
MSRADIAVVNARCYIYTSTCIVRVTPYILELPGGD